MKKTALFMTILLLGFSGQTTAGKYAAEFLRIGVGARALGLGGAYVAMADDGTASYWNPAGLADLSHHQVLFSHIQLFDNLASHNFVNCSIRLGNDMGMGLSWIRLAIDEIPRYGELLGTRYDRILDPKLRSSGIPIGYFADVEDAFMLSFARAFDFDLLIGTSLMPATIFTRLSLGVSYKFISQKLDQSEGKGQGLDLGLRLSLMSSASEGGDQPRCLTLGLNLQDLAGTPVVWNTAQHTRDRLPINWLMGLSFTEPLPWLGGRATCSLERDHSYETVNRLGAELMLFEFISVRGGLQNDHWTAGAGFRVYLLKLDYAFVNDDLGNSHRISGAVEF
ncbi:MAG: hypothetical protein ONB16_08325 [candidate division KSB1 bacterium]|nr:hypothetical protein [candidate division KSB1 bacterium]MDZ7342109.1 hypothetical protein [candidate division KSB1 bacterium]